MSQSAIVAIATAFVANGVLIWALPDMGAATTWILSGVIAFAAGMITMKAGERRKKRSHKKQ